LLGLRGGGAGGAAGGAAGIGLVGGLLGLEVIVVLAARGTHIPLDDGEPEEEVVDREECNAHHQQQGDVLGGWCAAVQQEVDQAGREREAEMDVERVGDGQRQAGQYRVNQVQRERHEHEGELERLGDTGDEGGQTGGGQDADGDLLLLRLGNMDHGQCGGG